MPIERASPETEDVKANEVTTLAGTTLLDLINRNTGKQFAVQSTTINRGAPIDPKKVIDQAQVGGTNLVYLLMRK